jgi:hydroxymethylpyrimidine pyrophosphatase-like HAD family hydrolase
LKSQEFRGGGVVKKLIVFDLDGTLAESRSSLDTEMSALLHDLLGIVKVAVISGGDWPQFEKQLLSNLPHDERLVNLSLLPTCGTKFFQYTGNWKKIYSEDFTADEKEKIVFGNSRQRLRLFRQRLSTDFPRPLWTETRWT